MMNEDKDIWMQAMQNVKKHSAKERIEVKNDLYTYQNNANLKLNINLEEAEREDLSKIKISNIKLKLGEKNYINQKQLRKILSSSNFIVLDLHGYNMEDSHTEVATFIKDAFLQQNRFLKIITGKGSAENPSVLQENLPIWLRDERILPLILFYDYEKNNEGCMQIILKKK